MRKTQNEYQARLNELVQQITAADHAEFNRIMATPTCHEVNLTPTLAALMMTQHNSYNRPLLNFRNIAKMSAEIATGDFPLTGQGFTITTKGDLGDGQHRCAAVIHAGKAIPRIVIVTGVAQASISKVDHNMSLRTLGDDLALVNVNMPAQKGRVAEMIMRYNDMSDAARGSKISHDDVDGLVRITKSTQYRRVDRPRQAYVDFVVRHDDLLSQAIDVGIQSLTTPQNKPLPRPAMMGGDVAAVVYFLLAMAGHDEVDVTDFILALQAFEEKLKGGPEAWLMHRRAMNKSGAKKNLKPMDLVAIGVVAGNYSLGATEKMARWVIDTGNYPKARDVDFITKTMTITNVGETVGQSVPHYDTI